MADPIIATLVQWAQWCKTLPNTGWVNDKRVFASTLALYHVSANALATLDALGVTTLLQLSQRKEARND